MTCTDPIPFESLVGLWTGDLADAERVEEHLFTCDACAAASARLDRLMGSLLGQIPPVVSRRMRDQLAARGLRIKDVVFEHDGSFEFGADLDLVFLALRADLTDARQVDVEVADSTGEIRFTFTHVPFDAARGEVLLACQQHYREYSLSEAPEFRIYAVAGSARTRVATYVIEHIWL